MIRSTLAAPPCPSPAGLLPEHFSFSSMSVFQQCPRKWAYTYQWSAPREFSPAALVFGAGLHHALETLHLARLDGSTPSLEAAWSSYEQTWAEEGAVQPIRFGPEEDRTFYDRMARPLLAQYFEAHLMAWPRLLAIEESVRIALPNLDVPMVGRLDLLVEEAQELVLVDFKTSQKPFDGEKLRQGALQLAVYAQGLGEVAAVLEKPLKGRFVVLRKLLKPRIEVAEIALDESCLNHMALMVGETWRLIRAAHAASAFPPNPGWGCKGCPFQERCQMETGAPGLAKPMA